MLCRRSGPTRIEDQSQRHVQDPRQLGTIHPPLGCHSTSTQRHGSNSEASPPECLTSPSKPWTRNGRQPRSRCHSPQNDPLARPKHQRTATRQQLRSVAARVPNVTFETCRREWETASEPLPQPTKRSPCQAQTPAHSDTAAAPKRRRQSA